MSHRFQIVQMGSFDGRKPEPRLTDVRYKHSQTAQRLFRELREMLVVLDVDGEREVQALEVQAEQAIAAIR